MNFYSSFIFNVRMGQTLTDFTNEFFKQRQHMKGSKHKLKVERGI